jgi:hypothetical protein
MFNRLVFPSRKSISKTALINLVNFLLSLLKIARYYLFKFRIYLLGKHPYTILPFETIETSYLEKATNHRNFQWQTIIKENGNIYQYKTQQQQIRTIKEPNRHLFLSNEAGIFSHKGIVYHKELDTVVLETIEDHGNGTAYSPNFIQIEYGDLPVIKGLSLSICSILSDDNYAHFLLDAVSKLYLSRNILSNVDNILISGSGNSFQRKIFDYLQLPQNLIWLEPESHFQCEQLLFTSRLNNTTHACPWVVDAIRNLFLGNIQSNNISQPEKIIFASRKSASRRKTSLEDVVLEQLPEAEVVDFSQLSIAETIKICQECKLFIGFHGAAFANLVFCSPNIKVVELQIENSLDINQHYYYSAIEHLKMNHEVITLSESMSLSDIKSTLYQVASQSNTILV